MFDKLLILDQGGYPIYNGNPVDAVIYFKGLINHVNSNESECGVCGNVNPEQIFNIIDMKVVDEFGNHTPNRKVSPVDIFSHTTVKLLSIFIENKDSKLSLKQPRTEKISKAKSRLKNRRAKRKAVHE